MKLLLAAFLTITSFSALALEPTPLALSSYTSGGPVGWIVCPKPNGNSGDIAAVMCSGISSTGLTLTLSVVLLKEEVKHVESDAYSFLAGEDMTLALAEMIQVARSENQDLADLSDQEVAMILLQISEIQ